MKRKPAKTSKSAKSKFKFNCPMCDPKAKTRPWFILICLALLVIGASVLVINGGRGNKVEQGEQKEQVEGWKTYQSKNGDYLVEYPSSLYVREMCPDQELLLHKRVLEVAPSKFMVRSDDKKEREICGGDPVYSLQIKTYLDNKNLYVPKTDVSWIVNEESAIYSGIEGKRYTGTRREMEGIPPYWYISVLIKKGIKTYEIYFTDRENMQTFDQILSTFKFLK